MSGAKLLGDIAVVFGSLIRVLDHELDRCAGRFAFEYSGQNPHGIRFASLRGVLVLSGFPLVQPNLEIGLGNGHARRTPVHRGTKGRAMAFTPGRHPEQMSIGIHAHETSPLKTSLMRTDPGWKPTQSVNVIITRASSWPEITHPRCSYSVIFSGRSL